MFWRKTIDFSRKRNRSEHDILAQRFDNSSNTHRILSKKMSLDSIRFSLHTKNMDLSLKNQVSYREIFEIRGSRLLSRAKVEILYKTLRIG